MVERKSQSTKKALILSMVSMLLCCAMLTGSTFAWFSDSDSSNNHRIISGNLDIDLLWYENGSDYISIDGESYGIFGENVLWEPGATHIAYLAVENKGTLAVKYDVVLSVVGSDLNGALEYVVIDGANAADNKIDAASWAELNSDDSAKPLGYGTVKIIENGTILTSDSQTDYFALAVHMKEGSGNEYQNQRIDFDIAVNATQTPDEQDGFGDQYDAGITLPEYTVYTLPYANFARGNFADFIKKNFDIAKEDVTSITFGTWNKFRSSLPEIEEFANEGVSAGSGLDENVRVFASGKDIYVLVNDDYGRIKIFEDGRGSQQPYFTWLSGFTGLISVDLSALDTTGTSGGLNSMFGGCEALECIKFGKWFDTSKVTSMYAMFSGCTSLKELDLSMFNTASVTNMRSMFTNCSSLEELDLTSFDTRNVTTMYDMFRGCGSLKNLNLTSFNTKKVETMYCMFRDCKQLTILDLTSFDTSNVTSMNQIFAYCSALETIYASNSFSVDKVTAGDGMFSFCNSLNANSESAMKYDGKKTSKEFARIGLDGYFTAKD